MHKQVYSIIVAIFWLANSSFGQVESSAYNKLLSDLLNHSVNEIPVQQAIKMQNTVMFLDAREPEEFEVSHIASAFHVGYDNFNLRSVSKIKKDAKIIVYCSVGYRSEKIAEQLIKAGFTDVSNLYGGIFEWKNKGYDVYCDSTITEKVHAYNKKWGQWLNRGQKVYE